MSLLSYSALPVFERDYIAACYTYHLTSGHTLKNLKISSTTIKHYLQAANICRRPNPIYNTIKLSYPPLLQDVLDEYHRWESIPNRREPITMTMLEFFYSIAQQSPPHSFEASLFDWLLIGMQAGFRKSEWLQDSSTLKKGRFQLNKQDKLPKAFIASDFSFAYTPPSERNHNHLSYSGPTLLIIKWRYQKNNQNGQQIKFAHNFDKPHLSVVLAAQRIIKRAKLFNLSPSHPLSFFVTPDNAVQHFHHKPVELALQNAAKTVYKITDLTLLKKYTLHSVRVGACVLLHASQPDPLFIQFRLRWRSLSFMAYLRSTPKLAAIHNAIMNGTNSDDIT